MTHASSNPEQSRTGFTVVETVIAVAASSLLLLGLSAALVVAVKSSDPSLTPARARQDGIARLHDIQKDLRYAIAIPERTATAITVTVPDRNDADTNPETIRYAWSGAPGDPLSRQYNGGAALIIANDVHNFGITCYVSGANVLHASLTLQLTDNAATAVSTGVEFLNHP